MKNKLISFKSNSIGRLFFPVLLFIFIISFDSCSLFKPTPGPPPKTGSHVKKGPPPWAPAHGYRAKTRYVFFPSIGVYYDLNQSIYTYPIEGRWITVDVLPAEFSHHNLRKLNQEELPEGLNPQSHYRQKQSKTPGKPGKGQDKQKGGPPDKGKPGRR